MGPFQYVKDGAECEEEMSVVCILIIRGLRFALAVDSTLSKDKNFTVI